MYKTNFFSNLNNHIINFLRIFNDDTDLKEIKVRKVNGSITSYTTLERQKEKLTRIIDNAILDLPFDYGITDNGSIKYNTYNKIDIKDKIDPTFLLLLEDELT